MSSEVLDEAFAALEVATSFEERMNGGTGASSSTTISPAAVAAKYFEACGLLDRAAASISAKNIGGTTTTTNRGSLHLAGNGGRGSDDSSDRQVLRLLSEKSSHYKTRARTLLQFHQTSRPPAPIVTDPTTGTCRVDLDSVDARLSRAMDLDERGEAGEAVDEYAAAAAGYLAALRGDVGGEAMEAKIKKRLQGILDRIEKLKSSQGEGVERAHGASGVKEVPSRREQMKREASGTTSTRSIRSIPGGEYRRRPRGNGESHSDYYSSILSELRMEIATSRPSIDAARREIFLRACRNEKEAREARDAAVKNSERKDATEEERGEASTVCREVEVALSRAQHETLQSARPILADLGGTVLRSNRLDHLLVPCAVMSHATPEKLADFARQGPEEEALVDRLLDDRVLMTRMLLAGGARKGRYGRAMQIYQDILSASPNLDPSSDDVLHRLALGTCLEHAEPIEVFDTRVVIDPVLRYLHYECAYLAGELDAEFANLSAWECRMVVNADAPDDTLSWGRDMLRNYRPDHVLNPDHQWRYVGVVRSEVRYKVPEWTEGTPRTYQQMISGGGKCGPRAWFGRFASKSFGVPTWGCRQPGHAAMAHRTPGGGWTICLGCGRWDKSWWEDTRGEDFLLESEARRHGNGYVQVLRLKWIADALGEKTVKSSFGAIDDTNFFNALALMEMKELSATSPVIGSTRKLEERESVMTTAEVIAMAEVEDEDRRVKVGTDGVITIPAVACSKPPKATANILFMKSFLGGMQLHCRLNSDEEVEYNVQCLHPAERYALTARVVTVHSKQEPLMLSINDDSSSQGLIEINVPYTVGRWAKTHPVEVKLLPGSNVLNFRHKGRSLGLTVNDFTLTPCR